MSFKDLGTVFSTLSKNSAGIKDYVSIFGLLNGASLSGISDMMSTLKEMGEVEKGLGAFQEVQTIMETFDGSEESIVLLGQAFSGLSLESTSAILSMTGLSEAELTATLMAGGLTEAEAAAAAATIASGAAATGASGAFKALGLSMLNAAKGLAAFLLTNPVGQIMLLVGAVVAATKAYDAFAPSFGNAKEAAEKSRSEYQDTVSELEKLNGELERTKNRINELETKKTLTLTEEAELAKLKAQNEELENQVKIKQALANVQEKTAAYDARQELSVKDEKFQVSDTKPNDYGLIDADVGGSYSQASKMYTDIVSYTKDKQKELDDLLAKEKELSKEQARLANSGDVTSKAFKDNEKQIESLQKQKSKLTEIISENVGEIQTNYASLFDSNGEIIAGNEQVAKSCEELFNMIKDSSDVAKEIEDNINTLFSEEKFKGVKDQLVEAAKEGKLDAAMGDISGLSDELNKLGIPADKFKQSIQAIADTDLSDVEKQVKVLTDEFASGADADNEIESRLNKIKDFLKGKDEKDIGNFYDYIKSQGIDISQWTSKDLEYNWKVSLEGAGEAAAEVEALSSSLKLATADIENMKKAMTESNSATGLTADSIANIEAMFSEYDTSDLFNRTATGIHLNADALERLNEQYASDHAQSYSETLVSLNNQLIEAREKLNEMDKSDEGYEAQVDVVNGIKEQIAEVQNYAAAWQGVTNAYNEYVMAQSSGNERDSLAGVAKDKDTIKKTIDQGWGASDDVDAYFDLVLGENHPEKASEAWKQLNKDIGDTNHSLADYMATNKSGELQSSAVTAWFNDISKVAGEGFAKIEEDGSKSLDLTGNKAEILAQKFGTTTEYVTLLAQALSETGVNVDFGNLTSGADQAANAAEKVAMSVEEAKTKLQTLQTEGTISNKINLDIDVNTASTDKIKSTLDQLKEVKIDPKVDPSGAAALEKLKSELQKEYLIRINAQTDGKIEEAESAIKRIKELAGDQSIDVALKGDNGGKIKELAAQLDKMPKEVKTAVGIDVKDGDIKGILGKIEKNKITVPADIKWNETKPETPKVEDQHPKIEYKVIAPKEPKYKDQEPKVTYHIHAPPAPKYDNISKTVTYTVHTVGKPPKATGTMHSPTVAHKDGTMHNVLNWKSAYANGRVALDKNEEALVNELGTESLILLCHFM